MKHWQWIDSRAGKKDPPSGLIGLRGHIQPQNDATANFFANSERPILGLSNEVSFVPEILWKDG